MLNIIFKTPLCALGLKEDASCPHLLLLCLPVAVGQDNWETGSPLFSRSTLEDGRRSSEDKTTLKRRMHIKQDRGH